jgi:uncharacterized protein (TIGR02246 family)
MKAFARGAFLIAFASCVALSAPDAESQIKAVLNVQVDAWNRGDIPAFVTTYADDCIYVGKQIVHGQEQLLARYQKTYPTREAMGHLSFSTIEVHPLTSDVVIVTGKWHLERSGSEGNLDGVFSLVFRRQSNQWKIALDHSS